MLIYTFDNCHVSQYFIYMPALYKKTADIAMKSKKSKMAISAGFFI